MEQIYGRHQGESPTHILHNDVIHSMGTYVTIEVVVLPEGVIFA